MLCLSSVEVFAHSEDGKNQIKNFVSEFIHTLDPDHSCSCHDHNYNHICECNHEGCRCHDICENDHEHESSHHQEEALTGDIEQKEHEDSLEHAHHHHHDHIHHNEALELLLISGRYLKKTATHIREGLDVSDLIWKVRRYASMRRDLSSGMKNHLLNLMIIWPLSESLEVLSAPIFGGIGAGMHLPASIMVPTVTVLSFIALPGVCPLCTVLLMVYPLGPVHKSITKLRQLLTKMLTYRIPYMDGVSLFKSKDRILYLLHDRGQSLEGKGAFLAVTSDSIEGFIIQGEQIEPIIEVGYFYDGEDSYAVSLKLFERFKELDHAIRREIIKELGSNLYQFSQKAGFLGTYYKFNENYLVNQFFVENFENKEDLYIEFKGTSMFLSKKVLVGCRDLFSRLP